MFKKFETNTVPSPNYYKVVLPTAARA